MPRGVTDVVEIEIVGTTYINPRTGRVEADYARSVASVSIAVFVSLVIATFLLFQAVVTTSFIVFTSAVVSVYVPFSITSSLGPIAFGKAFIVGNGSIGRGSHIVALFDFFCFVFR